MFLTKNIKYVIYLIINNMRKLYILLTTIILLCILMIIGCSTLNTSTLKEINPNSASSSSPVYFKHGGHVWYSSTGFGRRGSPKIVEGADPESFYKRKLATGQEYGVDKNFVYCAGKKIEGGHGPSFNDDDPNYAFDKNQVYYPYCNIIEGADSSSFEVIAVGTYAKDKNNVYLYGKIIEGADGYTFELLGHGFSKDKNRSYYKFDLGEFKGVEVRPTTIDYYSLYIFENAQYFKDNQNVYYKGNNIKGADPDTFEIYEAYKSGNGDYAKDNQNVYFRSELIEGGRSRHI